jgi:hypothetical protein
MATSSITAYPLSWPQGWPTTQFRQQARFKTDLKAALANLQNEIALMGGKNVILSSNYTLGVSKPQNPGVCAYFTWQGLQMAIPCDRWAKIEDNVQAIALTVQAMRGMERWGAKHMIQAMFSGFKCLPGPGTARKWWEVLQCSQNSTREQIAAAYKARAKVCHPDVGGTREQWDELEQAYKTASL